MQTLLIKITVIISILAGLFLVHNWQVNKAVDKAVATQKAEYNKLTESLQNRSLRFECSIKDDVTAITKDKDAKIKDITRKYSTALASLQQYSTIASTTSNLTSDSSNAKSTTGITSEGLFTAHAKVSLGIAKDAEELKQHLNACYQQYDTVKDQLDNYRK
jgi:type II secretory pathway pseudopilin PulG